MVGYDVEPSPDTDTKTISVKEANETAIADTAKKSNGYAKITILSTND